MGLISYVTQSKLHVTGDTMSLARVLSDPLFSGRTARRMTENLVKKYGRFGDKIGAVAHIIHEKHGVDPSIIMQGKNRAARPMLTHRWLPLFQAWVEAGFAKIDAAYEAERARHDDDTSALVRLADLVSGTKERHREEDGEEALQTSSKAEGSAQ